MSEKNLVEHNIYDTEGPPEVVCMQVAFSRTRSFHMHIHATLPRLLYSRVRTVFISCIILAPRVLRNGDKNLQGAQRLSQAETVPCLSIMGV